MTRTAKSLKNFLERRAKYRSPLSREVQRVEAWATDFIRLVAKFGGHLLESLSSIYWLVPPFCPPESAIASQFVTSASALSVVDLSGVAWDDRLACMDYQDKQSTAISCCDRYFAVGLSTGTLVLYFNATCQEAKKLEHGETVKVVVFDVPGTTLASSGRKTVKVWKVDEWVQVWCFDTFHETLSLAFGADDLLLAATTRGNRILTWSMTTGLETGNTLWRDAFGEGEFRRPFTTAAFSLELNMMAVVYRGRPISLCDMDGEGHHGFVGRESDPGS